ncbi:DUF6059 family protein [Streptomyces sp. NPDC060053]|uniref:DUF6059 family protein n=1 Tax=Streptomyces sp. NPDC060053 TaxID=3347047 RepID=UPI00367D9197
MQWSARDALHNRQRHPRLGATTAAGRVRGIVVRRCVLPLWRSLVAYGLMCLGLVGRDEAPGQPGSGGDTPRVCEGPGAGHGPTPVVVEPPPGHPERLRPDVPLTEVERALARQLSASLTDDDPR